MDKTLLTLGARRHLRLRSPILKDTVRPRMRLLNFQKRILSPARTFLARSRRCSLTSLIRRSQATSARSTLILTSPTTPRLPALSRTSSGRVQSLADMSRMSSPRAARTACSHTTCHPSVRPFLAISSQLTSRTLACVAETSSSKSPLPTLKARRCPREPRRFRIRRLHTSSRARDFRSQVWA